MKVWAPVLCGERPDSYEAEVSMVEFSGLEKARNCFSGAGQATGADESREMLERV